MKTLGKIGLGQLAAVSVAVLLIVTPAQAADDLAYSMDGGAPSMFDIAFGVTFTSDYISRGATQTDHGVAVQPWVELDYGMFYAGYWGSNVNFGSPDWEHDLSFGVRPELGPVSLDIGYVRYIYSSGDCCGELYLKASVSPVDPLTVGGAIYYDPAASLAYIEGNGSVDLPHNFSVSGAVGWWGGEFSWNAGGSWTPTDWVTVDGRYYGGPEANRFVVSLSISSSLSALRGAN